MVDSPFVSVNLVQESGPSTSPRFLCHVRSLRQCHVQQRRHERHPMSDFGGHDLLVDGRAVVRVELDQGIAIGQRMEVEAKGDVHAVALSIAEALKQKDRTGVGSLDGPFLIQFSESVEMTIARFWSVRFTISDLVVQSDRQFAVIANKGHQL
jgi:hypothetical protein